MQSLDGARGAAQDAILRLVEEDGGLAIALDELVGNDSHHATGPIFVGQDDGRFRKQVWVLAQLCFRGFIDLIRQQPALGVQALDLGRDDTGPHRIVREQQIDCGVGVSQASQRIQAWRKCEANRLLGQRIKTGAGELGHRPQADAARVAQDPNAALDEGTRLAFEERDIGDQAEGDEIQEIYGFGFMICD